MGIAETIALTMGVAWASGVNLYAAVGMLGILGATGNIDLPPDLEILQSPLVIAAAAFMYAVEFFADKVPGVDTGWDALHTFIRIPAGAALAAGAVGELGPAAELAAIIAGGSLAASTHTVKAGSRVMINASPEPFTNWAASITEDLAVIGGLWLALNHPWLWIAAVILFVVLLIWLLPKIWRGVKTVFGKIRRALGGKSDDPEPSQSTAGTPPGPLSKAVQQRADLTDASD